MTQLVFHHDHMQLPLASETALPVLLFGLNRTGRRDLSVIGNPVVDKIRRMGVRVSPQSMDFLSIALAVTAADTFVRRVETADGWARKFVIKLPLVEPDRWRSVKDSLELAFRFLSGDMWEFEFSEGGYLPPEPYSRQGRHKLLDLNGLDCVCLFSGGLDSAIGAIDLLAMGRTPLLVSHAYKGDKKHQDRIVVPMRGQYSRFAVNANPLSANGDTEITMRTRSCNFLAFGALGACAVQAINPQNLVELFVPENGFISLNAPLTFRRLGSLSTRTTHPYFMGLIQDIFNTTEIPCVINNPYQFKTKGEMVTQCHETDILRQIVEDTVSCSHWKRTNKQCGVCVPCLIRRSSLYAAQIEDRTEYLFDDIADVFRETDKRDDLIALSIAIENKALISDSGPLPSEQYQNFKQVFSRGLNEVKTFLEANRIL